MKILLVAPQANDTGLGRIGGYCLNAMLSLGYEARAFDYRSDRLLWGGVGAKIKAALRRFLPFEPTALPGALFLENSVMNKALERQLEEFRPDILFSLLGESVSADIIRKARENKTITVNWFPDPVLAPSRKKFVETLSPCYDYFFTIDSEAARESVKIGSPHSITMPMACSPDVHHPLVLNDAEKKEYGADIVFIGTLKFKREEILCALKDFNLGVWGAWQTKRPELEHAYRRKNVYGGEAVKIYNASKIMLDINESFGTGSVYNVTPRIFEAAASGAFVMTNYTPFISSLFVPDKEIVCYSSVEELIEKARYYLAHDAKRKAIAEAGRIKALERHTYEARLKEIFAYIKEQS